MMIIIVIGNVSRSIPQYGNRSEIFLKVLHRNFMGGDEFLGQLTLPLQDFDVYEKPKARYGRSPRPLARVLSQCSVWSSPGGKITISMLLSILPTTIVNLPIGPYKDPVA